MPNPNTPPPPPSGTAVPVAPDYDALAAQTGGNPTVDYDALAQQHGGVPAPPSGTAVPVGFDVDAARKSGYSDDEILQHLGQSRNFDTDGALKAGYSKAELIEHLSGRKTAQPGISKPALPEELQADKAPSSSEQRASQTRLMLLSGLPGGQAGEDWSNNDKYEYKAGKAVGALSAGTTVAAVAAPEAMAALKTLGNAHPLVRKMLLDGLTLLGAGKIAKTLGWLGK